MGVGYSIEAEELAAEDDEVRQASHGRLGNYALGVSACKHNHSDLGEPG